VPQAQHDFSPGSFSPDGTRFAYGANSDTPTNFEVFVRDVASGDTRKVFGGDRFAVPISWSPDGTKLLCLDVRGNTDFSVYLVDPEGGSEEELTPHEDEMKFLPGPWNPDGSGFYLLTDEGREYTGLAFYRLDDRRYEWVETPDTDIEEVALSRDGRVLAWAVNDRGWTKLKLRDLESGRDLPEPKLPTGTPQWGQSALTLSRDGKVAVLLWASPARGFEVFAVETETGKARRLTDSMTGGLRERDLVLPDAITYTSFDGREISAWLFKPKKRGKVPAVLSIHGGPEAQERPWYNPFYQYLVSRGIAVLAPNIRGSTGYGKSFQSLIHRDWGGADLKDMEHAAKWLLEQDWIDPKRVAVYGGSYGGFATLSCVTRLPDYWAAAVDVVGPSNLVTFARAVPPHWKRYMKKWVGDPDEDTEFLLERSPITYVENVRAPLLVLQGANDPRVVKPESDQMVEKLRELGREVEYHVFDDEGHGFTKRVNQLKAYRLASDWIEKHLLPA
jgi:dipeptidyl aminopeptidase/acylaminoacyl peptidase